MVVFSFCILSSQWQAPDSAGAHSAASDAWKDEFSPPVIPWHFQKRILHIPNSLYFMLDCPANLRSKLDRKYMLEIASRKQFFFMKISLTMML